MDLTIYAIDLLKLQRLRAEFMKKYHIPEAVQHMKEDDRVGWLKTASESVHPDMEYIKWRDEIAQDRSIKLNREDSGYCSYEQDIAQKACDEYTGLTDKAKVDTFESSYDDFDLIRDGIGAIFGAGYYETQSGEKRFSGASQFDDGFAGALFRFLGHDNYYGELDVDSIKRLSFLIRKYHVIDQLRNYPELDQPDIRKKTQEFYRFLVMSSVKPAVYWQFS